MTDHWNPEAGVSVPRAMFELIEDHHNCGCEQGYPPTFHGHYSANDQLYYLKKVPEWYDIEWTPDARF